MAQPKKPKNKSLTSVGNGASSRPPKGPPQSPPPRAQVARKQTLPNPLFPRGRRATPAKEFLTAKNYERYLECFQSWQRLRAFLSIQPLLDDADYWRLLQRLWNETNPHGHDFKPMLWAQLLESPRKHKEAFGTQNHKEATKLCQRFNSPPSVRKLASLSVY
jgi:hypothetical protein